MVPGELDVPALMRWSGCGWLDLCAMPAQLVDDMFTWMRKEGAIAAERASLREAMARRGK